LTILDNLFVYLFNLVEEHTDISFSKGNAVNKYFNQIQNVLGIYLK